MRVNKDVKWEATDQNGDVYQYEYEPEEMWGCWVLAGGNEYPIRRGEVVCENWEDTKRYIGDEPVMTEVGGMRVMVWEFAKEMDKAMGWFAKPMRGYTHAELFGMLEDRRENDTTRHRWPRIACIAMMIWHKSREGK